MMPWNSLGWGLYRLWLARLAAPPGLGSSRDHSKCQTCLPAVPGCFPAPPGCLPAVSRRSPGGLPAVSRQSPGCLPAVSRLFPGCLPAVSRMFPGCLPGVSRLSPGCMSPGCLPAVSRLSPGHWVNTGATLGQHWGNTRGRPGDGPASCGVLGRLGRPEAPWDRSEAFWHRSEASWGVLWLPGARAPKTNTNSVFLHDVAGFCRYFGFRGAKEKDRNHMCDCPTMGFC